MYTGREHRIVYWAGTDNCILGGHTELYTGRAHRIVYWAGTHAVREDEGAETPPTCVKILSIPNLLRIIYIH